MRFFGRLGQGCVLAKAANISRPAVRRRLISEFDTANPQPIEADGPIDWLGLIEVTTLEPKPGVPPSSGHLAEVLAKELHDGHYDMTVRVEDNKRDVVIDRFGAVPRPD